MIPTVTPETRSGWRYSRQLYVRIQREQGRKSSIQSIIFIRFNFALHLDIEEEDEDVAGVVLSPPVYECWNGMTFTVRFVGVLMIDDCVVEESWKQIVLYCCSVWRNSHKWRSPVIDDFWNWWEGVSATETPFDCGRPPVSGILNFDPFRGLSSSLRQRFLGPWNNINAPLESNRRWQPTF